MHRYRYLPHSAQDREEMLSASGVSGIEELLASIPTPLRVAGRLDLPAGETEPDLVASLRNRARRNLNASENPCFIGGGAYQHSIPSAVDALISRGEFFTAYTPYQPEISQGTLQAIFEFQSLVCALTGLDVGQASLYQGAAAFVEGLLLANRVQKKRDTLLVADSVHPHHLQTLETYIAHLGLKLECVPVDPESGRIDEDALSSLLGPQVIALGLQSPNFFGVVEKIDRVAALVHDAGALLVSSFSEAYSLGMLKGPGDLGADIAVGDFQSFATSVNFGGPYVGVLAAKRRFVRQLPGRIVGQTVDESGERGFVLTLSTREQHIRREKATSNVCTNSGLIALASTIHLCLLGKEGLTRAASLCHTHAREALERLSSIPGVRPVFGGPFFNEFVLEFPCPAGEVAEALGERGLIGPIALGAFDPSREKQGLFAFTELTGQASIMRLESALREVL